MTLRNGGDRRAAHEIDGNVGGALALAGDELPVANGGGDGVDEDGVATFDFDVFHGAVGVDGGLNLDGAADVHFLEDFGVRGDDLFQEPGRLRLIFLWDDGWREESHRTRETEGGGGVQEEFG